VADASWGDRNIYGCLIMMTPRRGHIAAALQAGAAAAAAAALERAEDACRTADAMRAHTHEGKVRGGETTGTFGCSRRLAPGSPRAVHCRPGLDALGARLRAAGVNVKTAKDQCVLP